MKNTVEGILEGISALLILLLVEYGMVVMAGALAERWDARVGPLTIGAGVAGLFVWFCIIYTLSHRKELTGRDETPWRPLR